VENTKLSHPFFQGWDLVQRHAKSTPYLSCHRDSISAKVPGSVAGWLRQVPQPTFIAGPLGGIPHTGFTPLNSQVNAQINENESLKIVTLVAFI
jgi:hypothetical protein